MDKIIEHNLFKPVAISIITSFFLFSGFEYSRSVIADYNEYIAKKNSSTPIKINIAGKGINFDVDEDQVLETRVKAGDTMLKILFSIGADEQDIFAILDEK